MATNLFRRFRNLVRPAPRRVGVIESVSGTNVRITEMGGGDVIAVGTGEVGQRVYFRDHLVEGAAPDLPFVYVEE